MLKELLSENDNSNPTFQVQGYGTMDMNTTKAGAVSRIEKALAKLKSNPDKRDWENAHHILYSSGVVENMMKAVINNHSE